MPAERLLLPAFELVPVEFELRFMFMFEPFMLPAFEFDMFEFEVFEFDMFEFEVFVFVVLVVFVFDMFEFDVLALLAFVALVLSPPPQAERLATPANARSAKVLRMDRSPELL